MAEDLNCLRCTLFIGSFVLACEIITFSFASTVEVGYYHLVAHKQLLCLLDTCIVCWYNLPPRRICALRCLFCVTVDRKQVSGDLVTSLHLSFVLPVMDEKTVLYMQAATEASSGF
jgi:hypothetical protein